MKSIEPPCRRDCDARRAGCHGESCPYGWAEYEAKKRAAARAREEAVILREATRPVTAGKLAKARGAAMEEKRGKRRH